MEKKKGSLFSDSGKHMIEVRRENLRVFLDGTGLQTMKSVYMQRKEVRLGLEKTH